jgi:hypothetical protein
MADQILFKFKEYVQLWQTDRGVANINGPMIQYNTKIYKGATNTIDFVVRNNDRKPVNLAGYQVDALIQRTEQPELLMTKSVLMTQETAGKCQLVLLPGEIETWLGGFYSYTIRTTDATGKQQFLYTDLNRGTVGKFELIEGLELALAPSLEIPVSHFTPIPIGQVDNSWTTGALPGDAQENKSNGMHSVVAYTSNGFLGEFWIQASLNTNAPQNEDWFDIPISGTADPFRYTETHSPTIRCFNFTGNYYWIRILYREDPMNRGRFEKILYKR